MTDVLDVIQKKDTRLFQIGDLVRYGRTGTIGEIVEIIEEDGVMFAELNSTHLLYRLDMLTPISAAVAAHNRRDPNDQDRKREIEEAIAKAAELQDRTTELDSACAGAG